MDCRRRGSSYLKSKTTVVGIFLFISVVGTAGVQIAFKVGQRVFGYRNAEFLLDCSSVMESILSTLVWGGSIALQYIQYQRQTPIHYANLETPWDWKKAGGVAWTRHTKRQLALISLTLAIPEAVWILAGVDIPASIQAMLALLLIPLTMLLNYIMFRKTYAHIYLVATLFVIAGALVATLSNLRMELDHTHKGDEEGNPSQSAGQVQDYIAFIIMGVPYAYSLILTERLLKPEEEEEEEEEEELLETTVELETVEAKSVEHEEKEVILEDVHLPLSSERRQHVRTVPSVLFVYVVVNWWMTLFVILFSLPQRFILEALHEPEDDFSFQGGLDCLLGRDPECGGGGIIPVAIVAVVVGISVIKDVSQLGLTKYGSAIFLTLARALALPVIDLIMSMHMLGHYRETASYLTAFGMTLCILGVILWSRGQYLDEQKQRLTQF